MQVLMQQEYSYAIIDKFVRGCREAQRTGVGLRGVASLRFCRPGSSPSSYPGCSLNRQQCSRLAIQLTTRYKFDEKW